MATRAPARRCPRWGTTSSSSPTTWRRAVGLGRPRCIRHRRCIPEGPALAQSPQGSNTTGILPRHALSLPGAASITTSLGATRDFHHGLLVRTDRPLAGRPDVRYGGVPGRTNKTRPRDANARALKIVQEATGQAPQEPEDTRNPALERPSGTDLGGNNAVSIFSVLWSDSGARLDGDICERRARVQWVPRPGHGRSRDPGDAGVLLP